MKIRNSAKALVVHDGRLLLTRCVDATGEWYCCPGGGQEPGETLALAVQRECLEETGAVISVGAMVCVLEWLNMPAATHQVETYFLCSLQSGCNVRNGDVPDPIQVGVEWFEIAQVPSIDLRPHELKPLIMDLGGFHYLGMLKGIPK